VRAASPSGGGVEQVVQVVIQRLIVRPPAGPRPEDLRGRYLAELARGANRLPWVPVEKEYADPRSGEPVKLADVYTPLDTTELERVEREEELRRFLARLEKEWSYRIPAQKVVNREKRLLILGDPGSGKSTFVKHLTYTLAQAALVPDPAPWLSRLEPWGHGLLLPVFVELRAAAAAMPEDRPADARLLLGYLRSMLEEWQLGGFWPALEEAVRGDGERLLILLDGLDEVPESLRGRVVAVVQDFADRYDRHRYVVTCRPYAYVGQPYRLRGFREVTLAPFNKKQVDHFIAAWYGKLMERERLSEQEARERAARLQRAVRQRDLWALARRPLLLTVMTLLHTFRGQLPEDRTELYADAVDLLLRRWERRVGGEEGVLQRLGIPGLKMSDLEAGLYEVAFRAHEGTAKAEGTADIAEEDLRKWLAPYLGGSWDKAGEFVDYIRERAGLLIRHKPEAYTFPHRTFQEFLAACHLVGMSDYPAEAARRVREEPDRWREVFVLAAGHAARTHRLSQAIAAVNKLCPWEVDRAKQPDAAAFRQAVLAGEALLELGLVGVRREEDGKATLERTQRWLVAALRANDVLEARERAAAGNVLAKLGDPRPGVGVRVIAPDRPPIPDILWCYVPPGPFLMGEGQEQYKNKILGYGYLISRYPITNIQFAAFVDAGGYQERRYWQEAERAGVWSDGKVKAWNDDEPREGPYDFGEPFNLLNHPVVGVTWYEALAFCRWLTEELREEARKRGNGEGGTERWFWEGLARGELVIMLPSEAEWEKAARGGLMVPVGTTAQSPLQKNPKPARRYPWGDEPDPERANYREKGIGTTSAVGCFPRGASPYGVEDLSGNVWEWTRSLWGRGTEEPDFRYPYDPEDGREDLEADHEVLRVLRGGSFDLEAGLARCALRNWDLPLDRDWDLGFRVVMFPVSRH